MLRLIGKWLNAGVMEDGAFATPKPGTPQGGVISPLLANIYLHEVLDVWFEREVQAAAAGRAFLIRYADDFVMVFANEADARRVMAVLPKRFGKYGLTLHPEKTRLVPFGRPPERTGPPDGTGDLRPAGLHPLSGAIPAGELGGEAGRPRRSRLVEGLARDQRLVSRRTGTGRSPSRRRLCTRSCWGTTPTTA